MAVGHVHEVVVPTDEAAHLIQAYRVSSAKQIGDQVRLIVVDGPPTGSSSRDIPPTLEDAYLLLVGQSLEPDECAGFDATGRSSLT